MATTFAFEVEWDSGTWTDETSYVRSLKTFQGFKQSGDLVAAPGTMSVVVDNLSKRFSPGYAAGPLYGKLLPRRRVRLSATSGGTTWTMWGGFIDEIRAEGGKFGECTVACVDGFTFLQRVFMGATYISVADVSWIVTEFLENFYEPGELDVRTDYSYLYHVGRTWTPFSSSYLDALKEVCSCFWGRFFVARDGTPCYWSRSDRQNSSRPVVMNLDNLALNELEAYLRLSEVKNDIQIVIYPVETVGAAQVLWQARSVLRVVPGTRTLSASYHDELAQSCAAVNVITPVATTDYLVNDSADGFGFNYTSSPHFSLSVADEVTGMSFTLTNTASGPLYVTALRVRGCPVRAYDPVTLKAYDSTSISAYHLRPLIVDLPMLADENFAEVYAQHLLARMKDPVLSCDRLVIEDQDVLAGVNVFSVGLLDRVTISDDHLSDSAMPHQVRAVEYVVLAGGRFKVTLHLERDDAALGYWRLGTSGYCELGTNTRLGL